MRVSHPGTGTHERYLLGRSALTGVSILLRNHRGGGSEEQVGERGPGTAGSGVMSPSRERTVR
jgi:hypothetical protein